MRIAVAHHRRFATFLGVGATGVLIANGGLVLLREALGLDVFVAGALSWQAAIIVTFTLNAAITWRGACERSLLARLGSFELISVVGLCIYLSTIAVVQGVLHLHYIVGGLAGSGVASLWNYAANHRFTFRWDDEAEAMSAEELPAA